MDKLRKDADRITESCIRAVLPDEAVKRALVDLEAPEGKLIVDIQAADAGTLPWRELDTVRLKKYFIRDGSGKAAGADLPPSEPADFREGKARIEVEAGPAGEGALTLVIEELEGAGKADAPLLIRGRWECPALAD